MRIVKNFYSAAVLVTKILLASSFLICIRISVITIVLASMYLQIWVPGCVPAWSTGRNCPGLHSDVTSLFKQNPILILIDIYNGYSTQSVYFDIS